MKLNKTITILIALLGLLFCTPSFAQRTSKPEKFKENHSPFGRKKKEKSNQRHGGGLFSGLKFRRGGSSHGNADEFASNSSHSKRGFISRLFHRGGEHEKNASLRKTKPGSTQNHEQRALFRRNRTHNKNDHERIQNYQKKERKKKRVRGNDAFKKKKR